MKKPIVSFIITGDDKTLPLLITDLDQYLSKHQNLSYEIIVVTESDNKKTREITARFTNFVKNLELVIREKNDTARTLLEIGSAQARGGWHFFIGSQTSVPMLEINKIIAALQKAKEKETLITSSKYIHGAYPEYGPTLLEEVEISLKKSIQKPPGDKNPRFIAISESVVAKVVKGSDLAENLVARAQDQGLNIQEIPIFWRGRKSLAKLGDMG